MDSRTVNIVFKRAKCVYEEKQPFTDKEVDLMLAEARNNETLLYSIDGHRFGLLLEFMLRTGLRGCDTLRHNPAKCTKSTRTSYWIHQFVQEKRKKTAKKRSWKPTSRIKMTYSDLHNSTAAQQQKYQFLPAQFLPGVNFIHDLLFSCGKGSFGVTAVLYLCKFLMGCHNAS